MENFSPRETDGDSYGDLSKVSSLAPQRKTPSWLGSCETCPFGGRERGNGNEGVPTRPPPPQKSTSRFPWVMVPECVSQNDRTGKMVVGKVVYTLWGQRQYSLTLQEDRNRTPCCPGLCSLWFHHLVPSRRNFRLPTCLLNCCRLQENDQMPKEDL